MWIRYLQAAPATDFFWNWRICLFDDKDTAVNAIQCLTDLDINCQVRTSWQEIVGDLYRWHWGLHLCRCFVENIINLVVQSLSLCGDLIWFQYSTSPYMAEESDGGRGGGVNCVWQLHMSSATLPGCHGNMTCRLRQRSDHVLLESFCSVDYITSVLRASKGMVNLAGRAVVWCIAHALCRNREHSN